MLREEWESAARELLKVDRFDTEKVIEVLSEKEWADFNYDMGAKRTSKGNIAWQRMRDVYEKKAPAIIALGFSFEFGEGFVTGKVFEV